MNFTFKKSWIICLIAFCLIQLTVAQTQNIRLVSYNLLNFPNGRTDCGASNVNLPFRTDTLRKITSFLQPDIFVGCEIQTEAGCDSILSRSLNVAGINYFQRAAWQPSSNGDIHNMLFYNGQKLVLKSQRKVIVSVRDINQYTLYIKDPNLGIHHDTCFIEVFMCHLKAGNTTPEALERAQQTEVLMDYIRTLPINHHYFVCGDLNTYTSSEIAYQNLIASGINQLKDPINAPGNWTNTGSFDYLHTQSPRTVSASDCGVTGGMDDRFDHIVTSKNLFLNTNLFKYTNNSYQAIGNDGNHFNQNIMVQPNTSVPANVLRALFHMSDHLPVKADFIYTFPTTNGLALSYSIDGVPCSGTANSVTAIPNLGVAPFTFLWNASAGNQTTATATNLSSGSYCVKVTDANGLEDSVCMYVPASQAITASVFPSVAQNGCDGSAFVIVSGGNAPYSYLWNDPTNATTSSVSDLCEGNYTCLITDGTGCTKLVNVVINGVNSLEENTSLFEHSIYPNPFTENIHLKANYSNNWESLEVRLLSLDGKEVSQEKFINFSIENSISTQNIVAGTYFLNYQIGFVNGEIIVGRVKVVK